MNVGRLLVALLVGTFAVACGSSASDNDARTEANCDGGTCAPDAATPPSTPDAASIVKACTSDQGLLQVMGDCKKASCDATGAIVALADDTDVPPAEACTEFQCADGQKVAKFKPAGTACTDGKCDGKGVCKLEIARACVDAANCASGNCADGVCCDTACTDPCKSCTVPGKVGTCSDLPNLAEDSSFTDPISGTPNVSCRAPFFCNGAGKCLGGLAAPCTAPMGCLSGACASPSKLCLGATGEPCTNSGQCASGTCVANKCN
jgi:hypothetical protein